jgi:hypothetical protein
MHATDIKCIRTDLSRRIHVYVQHIIHKDIIHIAVMHITMIVLTLCSFVSHSNIYTYMHTFMDSMLPSESNRPVKPPPKSSNRIEKPIASACNRCEKSNRIHAHDASVIMNVCVWCLQLVAIIKHRSDYTHA